MANSRKASLSDSSVYRSIYNGIRNSCCLGQPAQEDNGGLVDMNKWSFVQKLLAIEEAHDRRRVERESHAQRHDRPDTTVDATTLPDVLSRWLNHQVLEDSPERPPTASESNRSQNHLPILNNGQQLSAQLCHLQKQLRASLSSDILQMSADLATSSPQTEFEFEDMNQMASATRRAPSLSSMSWCSSPRDGDISAASPNKKRPLRLPPILLPRLYTISPRPLRCREFLTPTKIRGPITDDEWEDLKDCRYIRHTTPRLVVQVSSSDASSMHYCTDLT